VISKGKRQSSDGTKPFSDVSQGFPILKNGTLTSKHEVEGLLKMSIKVAHLPRDIANPSPVH